MECLHRLKRLLHSHLWYIYLNQMKLREVDPKKQLKPMFFGKDTQSYIHYLAIIYKKILRALKNINVQIFNN